MMLLCVSCTKDDVFEEVEESNEINRTPLEDNILESSPPVVWASTTTDEKINFEKELKVKLIKLPEVESTQRLVSKQLRTSIHELQQSVSSITGEKKKFLISSHLFQSLKLNENMVLEIRPNSFTTIENHLIEGKVNIEVEILNKPSSIFIHQIQSNQTIPNYTQTLIHIQASHKDEQVKINKSIHLVTKNTGTQEGQLYSENEKSRWNKLQTQNSVYVNKQTVSEEITLAHKGKKYLLSTTVVEDTSHAKKSVPDWSVDVHVSGKGKMKVIHSAFHKGKVSLKQEKVWFKLNKHTSNIDLNDELKNKLVQELVAQQQSFKINLKRRAVRNSSQVANNANVSYSIDHLGWLSYVNNKKDIKHLGKMAFCKDRRFATKRVLVLNKNLIFEEKEEESIFKNVPTGREAILISIQKRHKGLYVGIGEVLTERGKFKYDPLYKRVNVSELKKYINSVLALH